MEEKVPSMKAGASVAINLLVFLNCVCKDFLFAVFGVVFLTQCFPVFLVVF